MLDILELPQLFSYLNCSNVTYRFHTKWFMEIHIELRYKNSSMSNLSVDFCVSRNILNKNRHNFDLYVREPSGLNQLVHDVEFDVECHNLIAAISNYLVKFAKYVEPSGCSIMVKETEVVGDKYNEIYNDPFLSTLHGAGFIQTDYTEHKFGETKIVTVFISTKS